MRKTLLLVMLLPIGVMAKSTLYVGDEVKIPMRTDDSIAKSNIITHLKINTPVTLIKKQENGWTNVEHNGKQGWMISRYLTDKKPVNHEAKELRRQLGVIKNKHAKFDNTKESLEQTIKAQADKILDLNQQIMKLNTQNLETGKLQKRLSILDAKNDELTNQLDQLRSKNSSMHSSDFTTIMSAITLLLGFLLAVTMNKINNRQNNKIYTL